MDRHVEPRAIGRPMPDRNKPLFAISNGISGLAVETPLAVEINGVPVGTLICTQESLEELVIGWSYGHGFLETRSDIDRFRVQHNRASLMLRRSLPGGHAWREQLNAGFDGGSVVRPPSPTGATPPPRDEFVLDARFVLALAAELFQRFSSQPGDAELHHVAASDGRAVMVGARDISRHNAFDKLVGWSLLSGTPLAELVVAIDGEIGASTAHKAIRAGARLLICTGKPTAQAVRLAQSAGLTLIGRALGDDRTIFTHPWRIDRSAK
jgi:FdhD protein